MVSAPSGMGPPDHRFVVGSSRMAQPPFPILLSEPMVPYRPYTSTGLPAQARMIPEKAPGT